MSIQDSIGLEVAGLREKAISLISDFESKNRLGIKDYNKRLDRFLKKRIGKSANRIFIAQVLISFSSLKTLNTKV